MIKPLFLAAVAVLSAPIYLGWTGTDDKPHAVIGAGGEDLHYVAQTNDQSSNAPLSRLPRLNLSGMTQGDWSTVWSASDGWASELHADYLWEYNNVYRTGDGAVTFRLGTKAPQLQAAKGHPASDRGLWEVDVTLPEMREGLVVAPLWLYNSKTREEIDFEFVGTKGLDLTLHRYPGGSHKRERTRLFSGEDLSNRRFRLGIRADLPNGRIDMLVDGRTVHTFTSESDAFPRSPLKPLIQMSPTTFSDWAGNWTPLPEGERLYMTIHGYRFTPGSRVDEH